MQVKTVREQEAAVGVSASTLVAATQAPPLYTKFFPIFPHELAKFFTLSSMMFFIVFIFTMTRDTKDALIVTNCGAEAIAFLKV
jgi:AAA family ATP:ADP antiporter